MAINAFAQVSNLHDITKGVINLLSEKGTFVLEVGYVVDMIQKKTFDPIYHEHFSYSSLSRRKAARR